MEKYKCLAAMAALAILAGCAVVEKDGDHIAIRHSAENNVLVQREADNHCAFFGKKAVKVQETDSLNTYILRTRISTFKCVHESQLPKEGDEKKPAS